MVGEGDEAFLNKGESESDVVWYELGFYFFVLILWSICVCLGVGLEGHERREGKG